MKPTARTLKLAIAIVLTVIGAILTVVYRAYEVIPFLDDTTDVESPDLSEGRRAVRVIPPRTIQGRKGQREFKSGNLAECSIRFVATDAEKKVRVSGLGIRIAELDNTAGTEPTLMEIGKQLPLVKGPENTFRTDSEGIAVVPAKEGTSYLVRVVGRNDALGFPRIIRAKNATIAIEILQDVSIGGIVLTESELPIVGARISVCNPRVGETRVELSHSTPLARTDERGRFEFNYEGAPPSQLFLSVWKNGYVPKLIRVLNEPRTGSTYRCTVILSTGMAWQLRVLDTAGAPIVGCPVTVTQADYSEPFRGKLGGHKLSGPSYGLKLAEGRTNQLGYFKVTGWPEGKRALVSFSSRAKGAVLSRFYSVGNGTVVMGEGAGEVFSIMPIAALDSLFFAQRGKEYLCLLSGRILGYSEQQMSTMRFFLRLGRDGGGYIGCRIDRKPDGTFTARGRLPAPWIEGGRVAFGWVVQDSDSSNRRSLGFFVYPRDSYIRGIVIKKP